MHGDILPIVQQSIVPESFAKDSQLRFVLARRAYCDHRPFKEIEDVSRDKSRCAIGHYSVQNVYLGSLDESRALIDR